MEHLKASTLNILPAHIQVPVYKLSDVSVGAAHIGATSNFGAANIMPFFDSALNEQARRGQPLTMGVVAIKTTGGPVPPVLRHRAQQDGLYTVVGKNGQDEVRVIGAVREVMNYSEDRNAVIERLADPKIKIITITATQAGYVLNKSGNGIDEAKPGVLNDMQNPWMPVTVPGILVAALATREKRGVEAPIIMSCDNLEANGRALGNVLNQYAEATGICSPSYMATVKTPSTVVDRITPGQNFEANQQMLAQRHGVVDLGGLVAEAYSKWVVEQKEGVVDVRLAPLASGGVKVVSDIGPHEDMKIRGLNGTHLALGLAGTLAGEEFVHRGMANPVVRPFVVKLLDQALATARFSSTEAGNFRAEVIDRFDSPEPDSLSRLLKETSSKVSARLVNYKAIQEGTGYEASAFAVAAWMRYMRGDDESGNRMNVLDQRASEISNVLQAANFRTDSFLLTAGAKVFNTEALGTGGQETAKPFFAKVDGYYNDISAYGVKAALERAFGVDRQLKAAQLREQRQQQQQAQGGASQTQVGGSSGGVASGPSRPDGSSQMGDTSAKPQYK